MKQGILYPILILATFEVFYIPIYYPIRQLVGIDWAQLICDLCIRLPVALVPARKLAREDGIEEKPMKSGHMVGLAAAWIIGVCLLI